jgi:predicted nuclease of predicted toxin-antitoxin system
MCSPPSISRLSWSNRHNKDLSPLQGNLRFLLDADLSPRLAELFAAYGHDAIHVDDMAHGAAADSVIGTLALDTRRCIVSGDFDFADVRDFNPRLFAGIVVLTLPRNTASSYIHRLLIYFLDHISELLPLEGKLMIVEIGRIRVRE